MKLRCPALSHYTIYHTVHSASVYSRKVGRQIGTTQAEVAFLSSAGNQGKSSWSNPSREKLTLVVAATESYVLFH